MLTTLHDPEARRRSYTLLAEEFGMSALAPRRAQPHAALSAECPVAGRRATSGSGTSGRRQRRADRDRQNQQGHPQRQRRK